VDAISPKNGSEAIRETFEGLMGSLYPALYIQNRYILPIFVPSLLEKYFKNQCVVSTLLKRGFRVTPNWINHNHDIFSSRRQPICVKIGWSGVDTIRIQTDRQKLTYSFNLMDMKMLRAIRH